jgi:tetratricopeptide (TPR) repeat protein
MTQGPISLSVRIAEVSRDYWEKRPLSAASAKAHYALALELRDHVSADVARLDEIERVSGTDVVGWLMAVPFDLARHGMVDEAASLCARLAEVIEADNFLADRAVILAEAGRREEAIAQVQDNLIRWPTDPWIFIKAGDAHNRLGDKALAATLYRCGLEYAGEDQHTRLGALERLLPLLDELGRSAEADALEAAEDRREKAARIVGQAKAAGAEAVPFVRPTPKIGRNDSCPCGSGKKYKKCCLGKPVESAIDDEEHRE